MKHKILIIEDNEYIRENTTELLGFYDFEIITACNGKEGFYIALEQTPDIILCDIQMPVMDGYHFLQLLRNEQKLANTRFVFFTASSEKKEIDRGLEMGADDYIVKPFTEKELLGKLTNLFSSAMFFLPLI